jgi:hypothetical protein
MLDVRVARAAGGKGWLAWAEPAGRFEVDPYHGRIPLVVSAFGKNAAEAAANVWGRLDA